MFSLNVFSQIETESVEKGQVVVVKMFNGEAYEGEVLERDEKSIRLKTENGVIELIASNVKSIEKSDYIGLFSFANPHDTRYFFGPSAIPIKKGKGYYQNILVTTNFANYAITDNISIGGGFEFISLLLGSPIWFLTPKVGFDISKNLHAGGGLLIAGFADEGAAALGYGVITAGHSETNLTFGAGFGLLNGEIADYPTVMLSGTHRLSNSIALLSENYIFPNRSGEAIYLGVQGIRIISKRNSFDIGAILSPVIFDFVPALPYVGYVRVF